MTYEVNPVHRDGTSGKSQWRVSRQDEVRCFDGARASNWLVGPVGWGLHLSAGVPDYLGLARDHQSKVFVAKFTGEQNVWHGYPADHRQNYRDIPTERILDSWMRNGLLTRAKIRKIARGQPCRL